MKSKQVLRIVAMCATVELVALAQSVGCAKDTTKPPQANRAPNAPVIDQSSGAPADNATGVARVATLAWTCSDPDGDELFYNVHLGKALPPTVVASSLSEESFGTGTLDAGAQYFWQIEAVDPLGEHTSSPVWSFSTAAQASLCVSPVAWTSPPTGGQKVVQISDCNATSVFSFSAAAANSWCTLNRTSGSVPSTVTMTTANNMTGFSRSTAVTITAPGSAGSPRLVEVTQASSVNASIVVRNAWLDYPYSVAVSVCGHQYDIGPGKSVTIPMCSTSATLCIWECPTSGCRWDCAYTVTVGNHYKVTNYSGNDLRLDGD